MWRVLSARQVVGLAELKYCFCELRSDKAYAPLVALVSGLRPSLELESPRISQLGVGLHKV
jgi:hypothetical protein